MDAVKILESGGSVTRMYDADADVLYLSVGAPRPALGLDIGDGVVVRYDDAAREVVGVTLIGLQARVLRELADQG